jgi:hypothetical protein
MPPSLQALSGLDSSGTPRLAAWPDRIRREGVILRTTENLSLRLDPQVIHLARRTAEEKRQNLREFFEEAVRKYVATLTEPEDRSNLLSSVEEAFLARLQHRLDEVIERFAALSAKEAIDQAHTLQIIKRVLFMQVGDTGKSRTVINTAWDEAVARVQKRGRPVPPEVVDQLQEKVSLAEQRASEAESSLGKVTEDLKKARAEISRLNQVIQEKERSLHLMTGERERLDFEIQRELWVSDRLEKQGMSPLGRRTAADLRAQYTQEARRASV